MPTISNGRIVELTATDLWVYLKKPVRTLAAWRQGVSLEEMFPPSLAEEFFAQRGRTFESAILTKHKWVPSEITVQEAFRRRTPAIFMKPRLEHRKACIAGVRLVGEPDIVRFVRRRHAMEPQVIDIKSHKKLQYPDQIQVTLYCFVLAKMLGLRLLPTGYVRLRKPGEKIEDPEHLMKSLEPVDVDFLQDELHRNVEEIASEFQRPQLTGVLAVHGVGIRARKILARESISTLEQLAEANERELLAKLKRKYSLTSRGSGLAAAFATLYRYQGQDEMIRRWKHGAQAILQNRPIVFKPRLVRSAEVEVYFDLEYDDGFGEKNEGRVWLASLYPCHKDEYELRQFFAASFEEERELLSQVLPFLTNPDALLVTYAGTMADLPRLKSALVRHGYDASVVRAIKRSRHLDLYSFLQSTVALPLSEESPGAKAGYGLKDVETLFGIPRSIQMDGFEALMKYHELLKTKSATKRRVIKKTLLAYAAEDVQNLHALKNRLSEMMRGSG